MKKVLLALSLLVSLASYAQPDHRVFTVQTGQAYNYLNQSISTKIDTAGWDDFSATVPIGFTFKLFDQNVDTIFFDKNSNSGADMFFKKTINSSMLGLGFTDLVDRSSDGNHNESTVYYQLQTGTNKIAKLEWKDAGFFKDTSNTDSINFQIWFIQNTNEIQVHFGPSGFHLPISKLFTRSNGSYQLNKPFFGFMKNWDPLNLVFDTAYFVKSQSPAVVDSASIDTMYVSKKPGMNTWPTNGTVYKFTPAPTAILGVQLNEYASVFPTAFIDQLFINISKDNFEGDLFMYDLNGNIVAQQKALNGHNIIQTTTLPPATYIINIKNKEESVFYKVIKY